MIPLSETRKYSEKAMNSFTKEFRMKSDPMETEKLSQGRINIEVAAIKLPIIVANRYKYKSRVFDLPGFNFISIAHDFIEDNLKKNFKINLEMTSLKTLLDKFIKLGSHRWLDIYFDGQKQFPEDIKIVYDYDKFIIVTNKKPFNIKLITRKYIKDYRSSSNKVIIPPSDKVTFNNYNKMIFADGKKVNDYTINPLDDGSIEIVNGTSVVKTEVVLLPNYVRQSFIMDTNWMDLIPNTKLSINIKNILMFSNGSLVDLNEWDCERKGNSLIKFKNIGSSPKELIIFHDERSDEIISSYNCIEWYRDNVNQNVVKELDASTAPPFISNFKNLDTDISCDSSYNINKDSYSFNKSNIDTLIKYNSENFREYINDYMNKRENMSKSIYINAENYNYTKYIRNDNSDVPSKTKFTQFAFPMVLVKISNPDYKPFKVYIDGIALYRHMEYYNSMGDTYIYIRLNKFMKNSIIEIELYNLDKEQLELDAMIDNDGIYKIPSKTKYDKNLIDVYSVNNGEYNKLDSFNFDNKTNTISIGQNKRGLYKVIVNNALVYNEYVVNSRKLQVVEFNLPKHKFSKYDPNYYRVYKNGRLIPRKFYNIEFPNDNNNREVPFIHINCQCFMSEQINVEFTPYKMLDVHGEDIIDEFGRIKLNIADLSYPISLAIDSIYLNGRKLNNENIIQKSSTGLELINIISRKNFTILLKEDIDNYTNFPEFTNIFHNSNHTFDDYIKDVMVGSRINDLESNVLEKDYNVMRDLYWDLYNEYLKYAIVDFGGNLPKYIAIKYSDLVDENQMILIDCSEEMNHWMPLDASKTIDQKMDEILEIYEKMLDRINNMETITPYELSTDEIAKLKAAGLITDNVIAIDLSNRMEEKYIACTRMVVNNI